MSFWAKLRVIWTLRRYVSQIRHIESPAKNRPGPAGGLIARYPESLIFNNTAKTFETPDELAAWCNQRSLPMLRDDKSEIPLIPFPDVAPLVFTHMDIHIDDILIDDTGHV